MRRVPDRLTPLDASFLHTETASAHMHVAWKGRFRPDPERPAITLPRVRAQVASRLGATPRFRMRLAFPPGGFAAPVWVDAEGFDLRRHVVALSGEDEALSGAEFTARADAALSRPLDRSHPLWEIHLAPRLEDGTVGLVMKIHHAMVDGKSALAVALLLLDLDPDAPEPAPPAEAWAGDRAPGPARLAVEALVGSGAEPLRALGRAARAAGSPPRLGGTLRRAALSVGEDVARSAPSSFLNPPIGPRRTLVGLSVDVERLLAVKREHGRLAQRRGADGRRRRAPTACSAATRGAGADEGDGSRVAAGRGPGGGDGQPDRVRVRRRCRSTCATRWRGWRRSARRPRRSRTPSGRPAARRC